MNYATCTKCKKAHGVCMPPILANYFGVSCPNCKTVTIHRAATFDEITSYKDQLEEAWG